MLDLDIGDTLTDINIMGQGENVSMSGPHWTHIVLLICKLLQVRSIVSKGGNGM